MKKKLLVLLLVVSLIASLAVGLAACNKEDEEKTTERASNSETIATAVAMMNTSGSAVAAEDTKGEDGFNLDFGASASIVAMIPGFEAFKEEISEYVEEYVAMASEYAEKNSISVKEGEVAADDTTHAGTKCYEVTVTGKDDEGKDVVTAQYKLYIKATKADKSEADIEGTEDYNFALTLAYNAGETSVDVVTINGSAKFDAEVNGMKFSFDLAELMGINANAYATDNGSIVVDINATIASFTVGAKVEVGKLSDSTYGAKVDATVSVGTTLSAEVVVNIVAATEGAEHDFTLTGSADITLSTYKATATLTGYADYDYSAEDETMEMDFSLNGTVSLASTQSK